MGRGGGGGGGFRSAPRVRRTTPTPMPATKAPAPAPSPTAASGDKKNGTSSSAGYVASNVADGTSWGAGNAMGHRLANSMAGPRTVHVVCEDEPRAATPAFAAFDHDDDSCGAHNKAFADCINDYGNDISRCQFYLDLRNQCRRADSTFA